MTNIVKFEEELKEKSDKSLTDNILEGSIRILNAKQSGALKDDELAKEIMMESKLFANLVEKDLKTEDDVDSYEKEIPEDTRTFAYDHKYLKFASDYTKELNTNALLQRENRKEQAQSVEGFSKGLRKVA